MRRHARVVIIGGGAVGAACLYHLAQAGISDSPLSRTTGDANRTPSWSTIEALRYQNLLSLPDSTSKALNESDPSREIAQAQTKIATLVSCGNRWISDTLFED